jgi:hypothetical protein
LHRAGHQDPRMHRQVVTARRCLQAVDEQFVVLVVDESGLLIQSAQNHMLRLVRNIKTCKPCHARFSWYVGEYPHARQAAPALALAGMRPGRKARRLGETSNDCIWFVANVVYIMCGPLMEEHI